MVYLRNKLSIVWKLNVLPKRRAVENLNKYFDKINKFKFIVIDFRCELRIAISLMSKFPKVTGFTFFNIPLKDYLGDEKDEIFKTLTKTQLFNKWSTNEIINDVELNEDFYCTNIVDNVIIDETNFYYGSCENKILAGDLNYISPNVITEPKICNKKMCAVPNTKVNIKKFHIKKDVCLENPMFYIKWRLFNNCNYHCSYCIRKDLNTERYPGYQNLLNNARYFNRMKIPFRLELIGGEVTLVDLKQLIAQIKTKKLKSIYISTNLYRPVEYFEDLNFYLKSRNIELILSCSLHEEECDENDFIDKVEYLSNIVDYIYLECVSTDRNKNTINKILNLQDYKNIKISLDYLRDRNDKIIAKDIYYPSNSKYDLYVSKPFVSNMHHSTLSGFISAGMKCKSNGLYIDIDGSVYRRSCKQKQLIANIKNYNFKIKDDIIDCPNSICNFSSNVEVFSNDRL